ncbi:efflux RND transporter periplasmic adaptor subunit [Roseiarcus sp.]|uniref:efflux RND transporter periplasmic adaptor subunit n=1 Tax=Roseiarcus sp. TaxID=1969460 RepID=UPI003D149788
MSQDHAEDFAVAPEYRVVGATSHANGAEVDAKASEAHGADPGPEPKEQKPVRVWRAILILIIGAAAVAYSGISGRRQDDQKLKQWTQEQAIPPVAVVTPKSGGAVRELVLPGNVDAFYSADIHGQVKGYVQEWRKDIGAKVKQGDVLAVVDTPELDQSIAVAQSELAKSKANLALAKVTAARWNSLRATGAVSEQAADEKDADSRARQAEVDAAQSNVDRLKAEKGFANIVAPFDGVVTTRNVDVGSLVRADGTNATALFTVADIHQMRIYVPAPESYAAELKDGIKATLELPEYPDRKFDATIVTTAHAIDQKSRTLLVELLADNKDGLLAPGAFTRVHFQIPPDPNTLTVPASALMYRDTAPKVATVGADNHIVLKEVQVERDLGTVVEITGLSPDARVVANPPDSIADGEEVRVMEAAGEKTPAPAERQGAVRPRNPESADETAQTGRDHGE